MIVLGRIVGWYIAATNRLGQRALRRMFPDDADEEAQRADLARLARQTVRPPP